MFDLNLIINTNTILSLTKIFFLVVNFMFVIFLIVAYKQTVSMSTIINDSSNSAILKSIIIMLIILSVSLFLTALVIL